MDQYHRSHKKKVGTGTGGRMGKPRDKKLSHMGRPFANTKIRENEDRVTIRLRGGKTKQKLKKALYVNVFGKDGKCKKVKILSVAESHNTEFVRQNIVTRGAILNTDVGKVRVTNRVGQDGIVNGVQV